MSHAVCFRVYVSDTLDARANVNAIKWRNGWVWGRGCTVAAFHVCGIVTSAGMLHARIVKARPHSDCQSKKHNHADEHDHHAVIMIFQPCLPFEINTAINLKNIRTF
jgi:hypothetical protein